MSTIVDMQYANFKLDKQNKAIEKVVMNNIVPPMPLEVDIRLSKLPINTKNTKTYTSTLLVCVFR